MTQQEMFFGAKWLAAGKYPEKTARFPSSAGTPNFPILRAHFTVPEKGDRVTLRVVGLGFFRACVNGRKVTEEEYLPLSTDYEARENYPTGEELFGHRLLVPEFDVTDLAEAGDNILTVHFGGGWYTADWARFGDPKVIYCLEVEHKGETARFLSSEKDRIGDSFVKTYYMTESEIQDFTGFDPGIFDRDFDESRLAFAVPAKPIDTEYATTQCPGDKICEVIQPVLIQKLETRSTYDIGKNVSAFPILRTHAPAGTLIRVTFSEDRNPDGSLDRVHSHRQQFCVTTDGTPRLLRPLFTWFCFRYMEVEGDAEVLSVNFVHTGAELTSSFDSDNPVLNWTYRTYLSTQYSNMHAGIPSDCPHIERRGYTGDGQLTCHSVMTTMDARAFYRKWIDDISDCQDVLSGHVQYTAPYIQSGGGPGGWGCAIVEVPYIYYKEYGDTEPMKKLYPQMLRYFDYLEAHSHNEIVISDKPGEWCLGDWCTLNEIILPAGFVNNYYYVKSLSRVIEIARLTGHEEDIPALEATREKRRKATEAAYYNTWDHNYFGNVQGANAFALDMGLGTPRSYDYLKNYYENFGGFDTGICGTEILSRLLFTHGDQNLAVRLLSSDINFGGWLRDGYTSFSEYWPHSTDDRSHCHPMFGSVVAHFFQYLLGITQGPDSAAYEDLRIEPKPVDSLGRISGSRVLPCGKVSVSYVRTPEGIRAEIELPEGKTAKFRCGETERALLPGRNEFLF